MRTAYPFIEILIAAVSVAFQIMTAGAAVSSFQYRDSRLVEG